MAVLDELKKYNFNFTKKFGQNFIFDTNLLNSIVVSAGLSKDDEVLEIGTGAGTLTSIIANNVKRVETYEIDNNLREYITDKFANVLNVKLNFEDIMNVKTKLIDEKFENGYHMIANLPYYITTPIIFKFLEESEKIKSLTIMVQLEVAERLVAREGTADYGAITASIATMGEVKIIKKISRHMFTPSPNVDSAIVQIKLNPNKFEIKDKDILRKVIKSAFAMRRKTLANNLKQSFSFSQDEIAEMLNKLGFNPVVRGEALSAKAFVELANLIAEKKQG